MEPKFIDREAFSVIGLRRTFAVEDSPKVPGLWQEVHALWPLLEPLQTDAAIGAVVMEGPNATHFDYIAGVAAKEDAEPPDGTDKLSIKANRYAVFTHVSTNTNLNAGLRETIGYIFGTWLPGSSYRIAPSPEFELYDARFDPNTLLGEIDYYVPIQI